MVWCNSIVSLIVDWLTSAVLLALFSRGYIGSILWAKSANLFLCVVFHWLSVHHCRRLTSVVIAWASTMFLPRSKNMAIFSLGKTGIFGSIATTYILIVYCYTYTNSYANLNMNYWECLWHFICFRLLITLLQNIVAMAKHRLLGDCVVPWTIKR